MTQLSGNFKTASKNRMASSAISGSMSGLLCLNTRLRKRAWAGFLGTCSFSKA